MLSHKNHSLILTAFLISLFLSGISYWFGFFDTWQEKVIDRFFLAKNPPSEIIMVGIDDRSLAEIGQWPWRRAFFAEALEYLSLARSVGFDIEFAENSSYGSPDDAMFEEALSEAEPKVVLAAEINDDGAVLPLSSFRERAEIGYANINRDADGIARKITTERPFGLAVLGRENQFPSKGFRIDWYGRAKTFPTISFSDVLGGRFSEDFFEGRIVLIGATAPGLKDFIETPFGTMSGVEAHANAAATVINGQFFKEVPKWFGLILMLILAVISSLIFVSKKLSKLLFLFLLVFILLNSAALISFAFYIINPVLYLNLAFILSSTLSLSGQYIKEYREKEFIRQSFQHYLAPSVVDELVLNPEKLSLGWERRNLSIMFSDIRGFTSLSERLSAEELVHRLNQYLTVMTDTILLRKGLVDKYIGDAIMAFWGAPIPDDRHAEKSCLAAKEMIDSLSKLNETWRKEGREDIAIGIGISSGEVVVGNMGSKKRFNYTIIGDEVNFTSRLEGLTKVYGVPILVSESTYLMVKKSSDLNFREVDRVMVKGKSEPRRIFELVTFNLDEKTGRLFDSGREEYYAGNFRKAAEIFKGIISTKEDGPSKILLSRCEGFLKNPPDDWTGSYKFASK